MIELESDGSLIHSEDRAEDVSSDNYNKPPSSRAETVSKINASTSDNSKNITSEENETNTVTFKETVLSSSSPSVSFKSCQNFSKDDYNRETLFQ